jgi:hypothetical protein
MRFYHVRLFRALATHASSMRSRDYPLAYLWEWLFTANRVVVIVCARSRKFSSK